LSLYQTNLTHTEAVLHNNDDDDDDNNNNNNNNNNNVYLQLQAVKKLSRKYSIL
jgi:hypothetical protein